MAKEVTLKHPIPLADNKELTKLTMRDYTTAADYLTFDLMGGVEQRIKLVANLCGTEPEVIEKLRGVDYKILAQMAEDVLIADDEALESHPEIEENQKAAALEKKS